LRPRGATLEDNAPPGRAGPHTLGGRGRGNRDYRALTAMVRARPERRDIAAGHANRSRPGSITQMNARMRRIALEIARLGAPIALVLWVTLGSARADYQAGLAAYDTGDYAKAATEWRTAAQTGDAKAQHGLGLLYDSGLGVPQDFKLAAEWYSKAANQGLAPAASNLALLYALGRGVDKDMARAAQLWTLAAQAGEVTAQFNLGLLYYRGNGVARNYGTAATWLLK